VLFKALAKKPEDRYQSMAEFSAALEGLVSIGPKVGTAPARPSKIEDDGEYQTGTETIDVAVLSVNLERSQKTDLNQLEQESLHGSPNKLDIGAGTSTQKESGSPEKSTSTINSQGTNPKKDPSVGLKINTRGDNDKNQIKFYKDRYFWTNFGIMGFGFFVYFLLWLFYELRVIFLSTRSEAVLWLIIGAFVGIGLRKQIGIHWTWVLSIGFGFGFFPLFSHFFPISNVPITVLEILSWCYIFLPGLLISLACLVRVKINWWRFLSILCLWSALQFTYWALVIPFQFAALEGILCCFVTLLLLRGLQPKKVSTINEQ
jgi:hypothetical protein